MSVSTIKSVASLLLATLVFSTATAKPKQTPDEEVRQAMRLATEFMMEKVSYNGGFVWHYLPDFSRQWGEMEAKRTMVWIQPPGTPSVGHLLLDAYHCTGDEYYYDQAKRVANALIWGQLPCGGWNYVFDFAGENSLKEWYSTVGKAGWRLEEFQHYYGNATFDDGGTMEAATFLLRLYVEKNDPIYRPALEKVINFVLESQYPIGGWPQRYPLRYDHPFHGKPDYTSFITLNDDVIPLVIEFLTQCYQALGMQNRSLRCVFLYRASMIALRGLLWGNAVGVAICLVQHHFKLIGLDAEGYILSSVPIALEWGWWALLNVGFVVAIVLLMLLPASVVATVKPDETMRYE